MKNIHFPLIVILLFAICGCSTKFEKNPHYATPLESAYFERDKNFCLAIAQGSTPSPQMMPVPESYSFTSTGSGYVNTQHGSGNYNYSSTTRVNNDAAAFNAGMYNLGAGIGALVRRKQNYNQCMRIIGWVVQKEFTAVMEALQENNTKVHFRIAELKSDPLFDDVIRFINGFLQAMPAGERDVVAKRLTTDIDHFESVYKEARPHVEKIRNRGIFNEKQEDGSSQKKK